MIPPLAPTCRRAVDLKSSPRIAREDGRIRPFVPTISIGQLPPTMKGARSMGCGFGQAELGQERLVRHPQNAGVLDRLHGMLVPAGHRDHVAGPERLGETAFGSEAGAAA